MVAVNEVLALVSFIAEIVAFFQDKGTLFKSLRRARVRRMVRGRFPGVKDNVLNALIELALVNVKLGVDESVVVERLQEGYSMIERWRHE